MSATFIEGAIPDPIPVLEPDGLDFDPEFPGSTPDAPYGFFDDGRPRKRRPKGSSSGGGKATGPGTKSVAAAAQAASLLARMNSLMCIGFKMANMPKSAESLEANNALFEVMARESLAADPQLCRKILSVGASSGKGGLALAYLMLGANIYPDMRDEYKETRALAEREYDDGSISPAS